MQNTVQAVCVICLKHFDKYSKKQQLQQQQSIYKMKEASPKTYKIYWTISEWTQMKRIWIVSMCAKWIFLSLATFESCCLQITYNLNRLLASFRYYLFVW